MEKSLQELAEYLGGKVFGDGTVVISRLSRLDDAGEGDMTFLANPKYAGKVATTRATAIILPPNADAHGRNAIVVTNPYLAFAKLLTLFVSRPSAPLGIMEGSFVGKNVRMGKDVSIHSGVFIGDNVTLGNRVTLHPGVVLYEGVVLGDEVTLHANVSVRERCRLGNRVTLHNGAVVGSDGFGYAPDGSGWYKIPQVGIVVIEDDVEVGANTTIDRAALHETRIRRGTKIDNLVQIAHNCDIGENCMIVSQAGIAGSVKLGAHVTLGGQVGVAGHLEIGANAMVGGQSGVAAEVPAGTVVSGSPAFSHREWLRASSVYPRLPELRKSLTTLEKRIEELETKLANKIQ